MKKKNNLTVVMEGYITPVVGSSLTCAPIRPQNETHYSEKYTQGDKYTARLPRMTVTHNGVRTFTAFFPAKGIRGKLRRMARNAVYEILQSVSDNPGWDVETHRNLTIGGVKGSGSETGFNLAKINMVRNQYPTQSLFGQSEGFGVSWLSGKLMVGMAVPETPLIPDIITGVRSDDLKRNPDEARFLNDGEFKLLDEIALAEKKSTQLRRNLKDLLAKRKALRGNDSGEKELDKEIKVIEEKLNLMSDLVNSDVSVQMPLPGYEYIPSGTKLYQRILLRNASESEFGALIYALEQFANDTLLGAHAADGAGIVECEWSVKVNNQHVGDILVHPFDRIEVTGDDLVNLCDSAKESFKEKVLSSPLSQVS